MNLLLGLLAWLLLAFVAGRLMAQAGRMYMVRTDGMYKCPACGERFNPEPPGRWTRVSKCLNGLEYCAACKRAGRCGC